MGGLPVFRKPDRYKASSYHSYNTRMPSRYDSCIWIKFCQMALWDRTLLQELGSNTRCLRILDVGCATGRLLERLAAAGAMKLYGVDLAPRILEVARERFSKTGTAVELRVADAEDSLPWGRSSFDAVLLTGVLHHFFRPGDALVEIGRVLRPGGRLLLIDPCFFPPVRQLLNLALRVAPHDGDFRFYSPTRAAELLTECGFRVGRARRVGLWAYLVTGFKPGPEAFE